MPDVFRANVYGGDGTILWSSDVEMIGQSFPDNDELSAAMRGELNPELNVVDRGGKDEHVGFPAGITEFIEYYIPIQATAMRTRSLARSRSTSRPVRC